MDDNKSELTNDFIPNDESCQKLVEEFVALTNTDEALAQYYLQDRNWNVQISVNEYFDDLSRQSFPETSKSTKNMKRNEYQDTDDDDDCDSDDVTVIQQSGNSDANPLKRPKVDDASAKSANSNAAKDVKSFRFITWNIDGLCEKNLKLRTDAVCRIITRENADIVFLQEVIPATETIIRGNLPQYEAIAGKSGDPIHVVDYFTLILMKKSIVNLKESEVIKFDDSVMGRNLIKAKVTIGSNSIVLLNTHLESTKEFKDTRISQLRKAFDNVLSTKKDETVILAGDLNLRDTELRSINGLPSEMKDVWICTGSRKECEWTWDMLRNDNLQIGDRFKARCRFDRVFLRESSPPKITAKHFGLIGIERLKPHVCFPSDHWGIVCDFDITS